MLHLFRARYDIILVNVYIFLNFTQLTFPFLSVDFTFFGPNRNVKLLCAHFFLIFADYSDLHIPPPLIVHVHSYFFMILIQFSFLVDQWQPNHHRYLFRNPIS